MNLSAWRKPLMSALAAIALCSAIQAESSYYNNFQNRYPSTASGSNVVSGTGSSCLLCHGTGGSFSQRYNGYGWELRQLMNSGMNINQALAAAEPPDSDADPTGSSNLTEIDSDTQPGWTVGPHNTIYRTNGAPILNQNPPSIAGFLDPQGPGVGYCFGDPGVGTPCPCSNDNDGTVPGSGCANGVFSSGAKLIGSGVASVSNDTLVLSSTGLENNNTGLYFQANNATNGGDGNPFGDGLRCAGGALIRLQIRTANSAGESQTTLAIATKGMVTAGDTKRYQCWYRTTNNPPCGLGVNDFNLTNGYEVTWMP